MKHLILGIAALVVVGCSAVSDTELDGTDGLSLEGSFVEVASDLGEVDARKAAAAIQVIGYQEDAERYADWPLSKMVERAQRDANYFLPQSMGGAGGAERGRAFQQIAEVAGSRLDGMDGEDLVDFYNGVTGQAREEAAERQAVEARAEAEADAERVAAEDRAAAERAAAADAQRSKDIEALRGRLGDFEDAAAHNARRMESLEARHAEVSLMVKAMKDKSEGMVALDRVASYSGGFGSANVVVTNTTDAPITAPHVGFSFPAHGVDGRTKAARTNKGEQRGVVIAPGASATIAYPLNTGNLRTSLPTSKAELKPEPFLASYETSGSRVSLVPSDEQQAVLFGHTQAMQACRSATEAIPRARSAVEAAITSLEGGTDAEPTSIPTTRC